MVNNSSIIAMSEATEWLAPLGAEQEYFSLLGDDGFRHIKRLIQCATDTTDAYLQIAKFLTLAGLPDLAANCFEVYLSFCPDSPYVHQYLATLMFVSPEKYSHAYIYDAHVKWGKTLVSGVPYLTYPNRLSSKRRLRIGYTCHFINNSTSTTLLLPLLKAHHQDRVEIFMYSDQPKQGISSDIRNCVEHWRDTKELDDNDFCKLIRKDKIDILLELNGHCLINRYRALTRKPAPIQISYYNYSSTCGVPGIDYILIGEEDNIDHLQPYYSETIFHKKGVEIGTPMASHFPGVSPPPFIKNQYITFGSFGEAHKVSREQIQLWCEVLMRVPGSRFYMKATALSDPIYQSIFKKHFVDGGIDLSRVTLEGPSTYFDLLSCYAKMDIALDTYPFGAGTTTVEATIQGVPTISLLGERMCSQHGYVNLHSIGHDELLCYSKEEYIRKAVELALDPERLITYRKLLRQDFITSPRANMQRFITELEDAYYLLWDKYRKKRELDIRQQPWLKRIMQNLREIKLI